MGEDWKLLREQVGLSLDDVVRLTGIPKSSLHSYEKFNKQVPPIRREMLQRIYHMQPPVEIRAEALKTAFRSGEVEPSDFITAAIPLFEETQNLELSLLMLECYVKRLQQLTVAEEFAETLMRRFMEDISLPTIKAHEAVGKIMYWGATIDFIRKQTVSARLKLEHAERLLSIASPYDATLYKIRTNLGITAMMEGHPKKAMAYLDSIEEMTDLLTDLEKQQAKAHRMFMKGKQHERAFEYEEALTCYKQAGFMYETINDIDNSRTTAHSVAEVYLFKYEYKKAIETALATLKVETRPNYRIDNVEVLGQCYVAIAEYDKAKEMAKMILDHHEISNINKSKGYRILARCSINVGNDSAANDHYKTAFETVYNAEMDADCQRYLIDLIHEWKTSL